MQFDCLTIHNYCIFRSEPVCADKLSGKLSTPCRSPEKSVFMKGIKTLIHNTCSPQCLCQNCVCFNTQKNSMKKESYSKEKMETGHGAESTQLSLFTQPSTLNPCQVPNNLISMEAYKSGRKRRKSCKKMDNLKSTDTNNTFNSVKKKSATRTCTKCGLIFSSHREVLLHSKIHVSEKTKEFGCHLCGKYYSQRTTLRQHLILHSGEKNFVCTVCEKRFALKIYLKSHQKSCVPVH